MKIIIWHLAWFRQNVRFFQGFSIVIKLMPHPFLYLYPKQRDLHSNLYSCCLHFSLWPWKSHLNSDPVVSWSAKWRQWKTYLRGLVRIKSVNECPVQYAPIMNTKKCRLFLFWWLLGKISFDYLWDPSDSWLYLFWGHLFVLLSWFSVCPEH